MMTPRMMRRALRLYRSRSVRMSFWIAAGGAGLMLGNLVLAAALQADAFGRLVLFEAVLGLAVGLAPLGLDNLVVRRELVPDRTGLGRFVAAGLLTAVPAAVAGAVVFDPPHQLAVLLLFACVAGAVARMAAAVEQAAVRLHRSQLLMQLPNLVFALGAGVLVLRAQTDWRLGAATLVLGYVLTAVLGLLLLMASHQRRGLFRPETGDGRLWPKALAFVGIMMSVLVLHQLERLVIGGLLSLEELATFGVAATIVGSPYRILQKGIGYALMPRLRSEPTAAGRRRLVRHELLLALVLGGTGGLLLTAVARPLIYALYGAKYPVSLLLVLAITGAGLVRLVYGVASAAISALGGLEELRLFNRLGWIAVIIALAAAALLSRFGAAGVVAGVALGWSVRLVAAALLARPAFAGQPADPAAHDDVAAVVPPARRRRL